MKSPETLTIFRSNMLVLWKVTLLFGEVIKLHKTIMRNKALSKCRLSQKNCKKISWHKDRARRREADFSWEWCSASPPPDVYSYCLSPACHRGHAAPLAGQCWSVGLRPPFLLFMLFSFRVPGAGTRLISPLLQLRALPDFSNSGRRDAYVSYLSVW